MIEGLSLEQLFETVIERKEIPRSRIAPMRTAVKQYSRILGCISPAECPPKVYLKNVLERNRLIELGADASSRSGRKSPLGLHAVRNLKNNISYLLRVSVELQILSPEIEGLISWKKSIAVSSGRSARYFEYVAPETYVLRPIPEPLAREFSNYEQWSTKVVNRERPKRLQKRQISFRAHLATLEKLAGFLVNHRGWNAADVTLATLGKAEHIMEYLDWYIEKQGRYTQGASGSLAILTSVNKYLLITTKSEERKAEITELLQQLTAYKASLGGFVNVRDQSKRWLSLEQLESVGRSIYPFNALRISELSKSAKRQLARGPQNQQGHTFRVVAYRVLKSLMIRLLVRIPLRQRNLREMMFNPLDPAAGLNLFKNGNKWHIRFSGDQLKISHRKGEIHAIQYEFPDNLVPLLEEWINKWRPLVIAAQQSITKGFHVGPRGQEFLFVDTGGRPLTADKIWRAFKETTYKFTGVATYPHLIRTIWATEYIKSTKNYIDAAYMLGDTVETVLKKYAKLLDEDCGKRAGDWIAKTLNDEPT